MKRKSCDGRASRVKRGLKTPASLGPKKSVQRSKQMLLTGKKRRNTDPGIRHQGGRIYDSENGTTCHQCRQKTIEVKAPCTSATCGLQFCPRCLLNRYNEVVEVVRKKKTWKCPKCRDICNCSFCRKKQGLEATGILANIAKSAGFGSVSQLLEKNPHMVRPRKDLVRRKNNENHTDRKKSRALPLPTKKQGQAYVGVDDCKLKRRKRAMPDPVELKIHTNNHGVWDVPKDIEDSKLVCILEFFSTFGSTIEMENICLSSVAKSLIDDRCSNQKHECVIKDAIIKLKTIICKWFGNCDAECLSWDCWVVSRYMDSVAPSDIGRCSEVTSKRRSERNCVKKQRSFWSLNKHQRVDVVYQLIHESLECGPIVDVIESSIDDTEDMYAQQRLEIEKIKKLIKEEQECHKQRFIAELISSQQVNNLSAEKQQEIIQRARSNAMSAISEENKSRLRWLKTSKYLRTHPSARRVAIGQDRDGNSYYFLSCAKTITGSSKGILCTYEDEIKYYNDINGLHDALDVSGNMEGALRMALKEVDSRVTD